MAGDGDMKRGETSARGAASSSSTPPTHKHSRSAAGKAPSRKKTNTTTAAAAATKSRHAPSSPRDSKSWTASAFARLLGGGSRSSRSQPHPDHAHAHAHGTRRDRDKPSEKHRAQIELKDLDRQRPYTCRLAARRGACASKLEGPLRRFCEETDRPIPEASSIRFYSEGRELQPSDVTDKCVVVWYRVRRDDDQDQFRITSLVADGDEATPPPDELARMIDQGCTVGQLREKIAAGLDIEDANSIGISVEDGMREGFLQGNFWELRQLKGWLGRSLVVEILSDDEYVVVKGLGREYVLCLDPRDARRRGTACVESTLGHLFRDVVHHGRSKFSCSSSRIALTHGGKAVDKRAAVRFGGTPYQFELPYDAAEVFSEEESWLLPVSETCTVCDDEKKLSEMPVRLTARCEHTPSICKSCAAQWIKVTLETSTWDRIKCPECPRYLEFADVRRYASAETFARYDTLATKAALREISGFRWCLATGCESGQIHDASCPRFRCVTCKASHCVVHNLPWHQNESCEEYDRRHKKRRKEEKASEKEVKKSTKACPKCKRDIHKYSGCNHITCLCKHEWCYICSETYKHHTNGLLYCVHKPTCPEFDPFIEDIIAGNPPPHRAGRFPPPPRPPPGWNPRMNRPRPHQAPGWMPGPPPPPAPQPPPNRMHMGGPGQRPGQRDFLFDDFFAAALDGRLGDARRGPGVQVPHRNDAFADAVDGLIGIVENAAGRAAAANANANRNGPARRRASVLGALDEFGVLHL